MTAAYVLLGVAVLWMASVPVVIWLADRAPVGEFDVHTQQALDLVSDCRSRYPLDEVDVAGDIDAFADRLRFERMLHPRSGNGLCDLNTRWPK